MINKDEKNKNIIKLLLKTIIKQERKSDESNSEEVLSFTAFANVLELTKESECEKMYEDLGNMIENKVDLDTALDQFCITYNI